MRRLLLLAVVMGVCMNAEVAMSAPAPDLPETGPVPLEKPSAPSASVDDSAPVPQPRPVDSTRPERKSDTLERTPVAGDEQADPTQEPEKVVEPPALPTITTPEPDEAALAVCEAELRKLGTVFERQDPAEGENGCGIVAPYSIDRIVPGVSLSPATQLRCETALALARWTDSVVVPAAGALPDDVALTRINHGSTYVCRRRNNLPTGKMSEHSIGNAIDIMDFEFEGRGSIGIVPRAGEGTIEEAFQRAVRGGACLHFTTVLGPGTNATHDDHLHLDIAERRGGYRLCE